MSTEQSYQDRIVDQPITREEMASHRHYLEDSKPGIRALNVARTSHAEKFTAQELEALSLARRILDSKRVACALIRVKADDPIILF